jgi:signal peptidase II
MQKILTKGRMALLIIFGVLIIDQLVKVYIKTHMFLHDFKRVTDWFYIYFTENNGMAFGMEIGSKIFLTAFRVLAVGALSYYIWLQVAQRARTGYVVLLSMILAGAMGNLIDCLFYGQIFTVSTPYNIAEFVSFGQGYAPVMMGKVVDMFYFPLIETTWPTWMPVVGGQEFVFFSPVFNFADANVSVGIIALLLFYRNELSHITFSKSHPIDADDEVQE